MSEELGYKPMEQLIAESRERIAKKGETEESKQIDARMEAMRQESNIVFERRKKEVFAEMQRKGIDPGAGVVISENSYEIIEEAPEVAKVPSEAPPLNIPDISAVHSYGLNPVIPQAAHIPQTPQMNSFGVVTEVSKHLVAIHAKVEEIQNNQESVANIQLEEIYKLLLGFTKSIETRIVNSASSTIKEVLQTELMDELKEKIVEHTLEENKQIAALREDVKSLSSQIEELKEARVANPPDQAEPEPRAPTKDLGTELSRAFNQALSTDHQMIQEDIAIVEWIFDLALSKTNFDKEGAARVYVQWLSSFRDDCIDNNGPRTPVAFIAFVKSLI